MNCLLLIASIVVICAESSLAVREHVPRTDDIVPETEMDEVTPFAEVLTNSVLVSDA